MLEASTASSNDTKCIDSIKVAVIPIMRPSNACACQTQQLVCRCIVSHANYSNLSRLAWLSTINMPRTVHLEETSNAHGSRCQETQCAPDQPPENDHKQHQHGQDGKRDCAANGKWCPLIVAAGWIQQLSIFWLAANVCVLAQALPEGLQLLEPGLQKWMLTAQRHSPAALT